MGLSSKTYQNLAAALLPEVVEYIFDDDRWVDFMQEIVPDAVKEKLGDLDEDILYELSLTIMDRIYFHVPK